MFKKFIFILNFLKQSLKQFEYFLKSNLSWESLHKKINHKKEQSFNLSRFMTHSFARRFSTAIFTH